jgi:hypothetical protein
MQAVVDTPAGSEPCCKVCSFALREKNGRYPRPEKQVCTTAFGGVILAFGQNPCKRKYRNVLGPVDPRR